jgi:hypothetical protein
VRAHRGAGAGVALSGDAAYSVGADAWLRVHALADGAACHAAPLGRLPLSCLALLPLPPGAPPGARPAALAGSLDAGVYALSVDYGALLGRLHAHDDAVAAMALPRGAAGARLATASWDGTVRLWDLGEGRGFGAAAAANAAASSALSAAGASSSAAAAASSGAAPLLEFAEHEGALWSLASDARGAAFFAGGADGTVVAWDARRAPAAGPVWCVTASSGGVCGLAAAPDGRAVAAACEDGVLRLLDARRGGAQAAAAAVPTARGDGAGGAPSSRSAAAPPPAARCVHFAGATALAGTDAGALLAWDAHRAAPGLHLCAPGGGGAGGAAPAPAAALQRPFDGGAAPVRAVAAAPVGAARVASLAGDGTLRLYATEGLTEEAP